LNLLAPKILHAKYQCIPASGSWEEDFEDVSKLSLFWPLLGPKSGKPLYLNKSESPSPSMFPTKLVEISVVVLEKKSFKGKS